MQAPIPCETPNSPNLFVAKMVSGFAAAASWRFLKSSLFASRFSKIASITTCARAACAHQLPMTVKCEGWVSIAARIGESVVHCCSLRDAQHRCPYRANFLWEFTSSNEFTKKTWSRACSRPSFEINPSSSCCFMSARMISNPFFRSKSERSCTATRAPLSASAPAIEAPIRPAPMTAKS
jgi:hypothetical protein